MLEFMDYVQNAFYSASLWNLDNSYSTLTATANALLDFHTPHGVRLRVSSLSGPNFATSYALESRGVVDGSVSFLYSSQPLQIQSRSREIDLHHVVRGYRQLAELRRPDEPFWWEVWHRGKRIDRKEALLYGRLYLPASSLEALYLRRLSPTRLLRLSAVSDSALPNGGSLLAVLQNDHGKYSTEYLYSTDSALLGVRGLYNFGHDPREPSHSPNTPIPQPSPSPPASPDPQHGRLSAGAEAYFSPLNKSGGLSTGVRFATLPAHTGFPYTMTLTLNPLMGNVSAGHAVKAGDLALCSRFNFNFYSYESDVQVGVELWRRRAADPGTEWARRLLRPEWTAEAGMTGEQAEQRREEEEEVDGVLKARVDQNWRIALLWEGRVKEMLVSLGVGVDLKRRERMVGAVGLEVAYSS